MSPAHVSFPQPIVQTPPARLGALRLCWFGVGQCDGTKPPIATTFQDGAVACNAPAPGVLDSGEDGAPERETRLAPKRRRLRKEPLPADENRFPLKVLVHTKRGVDYAIVGCAEMQPPLWRSPSQDLRFGVRSLELLAGESDASRWDLVWRLASCRSFKQAVPFNADDSKNWQHACYLNVRVEPVCGDIAHDPLTLPSCPGLLGGALVGLVLPIVRRRQVQSLPGGRVCGLIAGRSAPGCRRSRYGHLPPARHERPSESMGVGDRSLQRCRHPGGHPLEVAVAVLVHRNDAGQHACLAAHIGAEGGAGTRLDGAGPLTLAD